MGSFPYKVTHLDTKRIGKLELILKICSISFIKSVFSLNLYESVIAILEKWLNRTKFLQNPATVWIEDSCTNLTQHVPGGSLQSSCRSQNVPGAPGAASFLQRPYVHCPLQHWPFSVQATFSFRQWTQRNMWQYLPEKRKATKVNILCLSRKAGARDFIIVYSLRRHLGSGNRGRMVPQLILELLYFYG